jgi:hypothetical protein
MLGLYFESEEVAQQFSSIIREDIASRINSGELRLGFDVPWLRSARYSVAAVEAVVGKVRDKYPSEVTDSQLLTAAEACARELGRTPTADELFRWIEEHREFPQG